MFARAVPRHGYEPIRSIEETTGGTCAPIPGVLCPTLILLDEMGLIEEQASQGAKRRFEPIGGVAQRVDRLR